MSMESALYSYLVQHATVAPLLGNRIWMDLARTKEVMPYMVYGLDDYRSVQYMQGATDLAESTYELQVHAETAASGQAVAEALRLALDGYRGLMAGVIVRSAWLGPMRSQVEDDQSGGQQVFYQRIASYRIWHTRTI